MAGIPLKSGADFCVLEATRMRLHNMGEDPNEYGDGLIYFNTSEGKNTSKRIRIYDGTTFRSLAFLDEIANNEAFNALVGRVDEAEGDITSLEGRATSLEGRATATEGNLSTLKARVDAFLDGGVDSDAVLENLKEIQAFLDAYDGATSLAEILDTKFDKAGGTITISSYYGMVLKHSNAASNPRLWFANGGGYLGALGVTADKHAIFDDGTVAHTLLHSGNFAAQIGNTYLKTDGSNTMTNGLQLYTLGSGSANVPLTDGMFIYRGPSTGGVDVGLPDSFTNVLNIGGSTAYSNLQLAWFRSMDVLKLYARVGEAKGYGAWKEILHAGNYSDLITTINKSLSIGGNVTLGKDKYLHLTNTSNKVVDALRIHTNNVLYVGYGSYQEKQDTWLWGKNIKFIYGEQGISAMTIDENGDIHISKNLIVDGEVSAGGAGEEGSDDMGLALLENWADYDATKAQALGAVLGKDMYDRIVTLEGKSTNVQFTPTLSSGKQIGAITIDGVTTGIFAPDKLSQFTDDVVAGNYLPLTGGTLKREGNFFLSFNSLTEDAGWVGIRFLRRDVSLGCLGLSSSKEPVFIPHDVSTLYKLLHSGNVGEYALKVDGSNAMKAGIDWNDAAVGVNVDNFGTGLIVGKTTADGTSLASYGYKYASVLNVSDGDYRFQIASNATNNNILAFRGYNANTAEWKDWKTIAFTDSDITGYAAGLKHSNGKVGAILNASGCVTIGSSDLATSNYKLYVDGVTATHGLYIEHLNGKTSDYGAFLLQYHSPASNNALVLTTRNTEGNLKGHAFSVNYDTGNVIIGGYTDNGSSAKLQVAGGATFDGALSVASTIYLKRNSHNYIWASEAGGLIHLGVKDTADAGVANASLSIYSQSLRPGTRNNEVSLGTSSYRWSNVYSTLGNFSSRVIIGNGTDDGTNALQIKGTTRVDSTTNWETESIKISSYGIKYYGRKDGGYVQGLMFYSYDGTELWGLGNNSDSFYIGNSYNNPWLSIKDSVLNVHIPTQLSSSLEVNDTSSFGGQSTFNALALFNKPIVAKDTLQIGEATLSWDADKNALKVDKNIYSDGEVSAGGAGEEGETESTGNASAWAQTFTPTNTTMPFEHNRATTDVIVQVYEKNDGGSWDMILVDVEIISETKVNLHFGRTENREHKIVIMG